MKRRTRIQYTGSHKALMWDRWRQGESLHQMARLFDRHHSSVRGVLAETGGMRQWSPYTETPGVTGPSKRWRQNPTSRALSLQTGSRPSWEPHPCGT